MCALPHSLLRISVMGMTFSVYVFEVLETCATASNFLPHSSVHVSEKAHEVPLVLNVLQILSSLECL